MQRDASAIMFHTETKGEKLCDHVEGLVVAGYCLRVCLSNCAGMRIGTISTCKRVCMHVPMSARPIGDGRKAA